MSTFKFSLFHKMTHVSLINKDKDDIKPTINCHNKLRRNNYTFSLKILNRVGFQIIKAERQSIEKIVNSIDSKFN